MEKPNLDRFRQQENPRKKLPDLQRRFSEGGKLFGILCKQIVRYQKKKFPSEPAADDFAVGAIRIGRTFGSEHHIGVEHGSDLHAQHLDFERGDKIADLFGNTGTVETINPHLFRGFASFLDQLERLRLETLLPLGVQNGLSLDEAHDTFIKVRDIPDLVRQVVWQLECSSHAINLSHFPPHSRSEL